MKRRATINLSAWMAAGCLTLGASLLLLAGCDSRTSDSPRRGPATQAGTQGALFDSVLESINNMEQFNTGEILKQICDRLNQWYLQDKPQVAWQPDPLIEQLPDDLRSIPAVKLLDSTQYRLSDAWYLQESVWMRDISRTARADQFEDLAVAQRLFDWTVRNIALETEPTSEHDMPKRPFETLLTGRGRANERALVFILLARQQGLDVVMLGLADGEGDQANPQLARPWLPALVSGDNLYLFDTRLGIPIPGPEGQGVATLAQVAAEESLLRRLDLDDEHRYPVQADDLKHVVAWVEGSPASLSRRMALIESKLTGKYKMALTSPGSSLAERVKKFPQVSDARLWPLPFEISKWQTRLTEETAREAARDLMIFQAIPALFKGRALYFKGQYDGDTGAKTNLLNARPPDAYIENYKLPAETAKRFAPEDVSKVEASQIVLMQQGKQHASYWLGLLMFAEEDYPNAIDFLAKRTLEANPRGPWTAAARYNLARAYEASGDLPKAIKLYESDTTSPQSHGNQLRARWLKEGESAAAPTAAPANEEK